MTVTVVTPDVEGDVLAILAADPGTSALVTPNVNAFVGEERPSSGGAGIPMQAIFVRNYATSYDHDNDSLIRIFQVTTTIRGGRNGETAANAKARAIHDVIASFGFNNTQFIGTSGARYFDLQVTGFNYVGPGETDATYYTVDAEISFGG